MLDILVTVVIPFYKYADWLYDAIESALNQTYNNVEIIVINDSTVEDIAFIRKEFDSRVTFIDLNQNLGAAAARNVGIRLAKGEYIAFLDSDDLWDEHKVELQLGYMIKHNYIWTQHSFHSFFYNNQKDTKFIDTSSYFGDVLCDTFLSFKVQTSTIMVKKNSILNKNIFFPEQFRAGQDGEFFKGLAMLYPLGHVSGAFGYFRRRRGSTGFQPSVQLRSRFMVHQKYIDGGYGAIKLCRSIEFLYAYSSFCARLLALVKIDGRNGRKLLYEIMSGSLYFPAYIGFKFMSYLSIRKCRLE